MPVFRYRARDLRGDLVAEKLTFHDELALREYLRRHNLFVIEVEEEQQQRGLRLPFQQRVALDDLVVSARQLRTIISAGMPLALGLQSLAEQATNPRLKDVLTELYQAVGHGVSLSAAMELHPQVFPPLLLALVRSGEEGGRLPDALAEAVRQLEMQMEIRQKMLNALLYPAFTLVVTVAGVLFLMVSVVPVFAGIYQDLGAPLPPMTSSLLATSQLLLRRGWIVLLLALAAGYGLQRYFKKPQGRLKLDGWKLRLPLFGPLFVRAASASLLGTLAGLIDSGIPIVPALRTAATVCGNEVIAEATLKAAREVEGGSRLSRELEATQRFPVVVIRMLAVAEQVGTLPMVLREIASSYNAEVDYTVRRILGLIEPVLVLFVGLIVGYVLLALYSPIFQLGNLFSKPG